MSAHLPREGSPGVLDPHAEGLEYLDRCILSIQGVEVHTVGDLTVGEKVGHC